MDIIAIIIAGLALLLSAFTYFKHDRSLKKQATQINKYQIEKIEKDIEQSKKAIIVAQLIKEKPGYRIIRVFNKGKSIAKSVKVKILSAKGIEVLNNEPSQLSLFPDLSFEIPITIDEGHADKIALEFEWNDDFQKGNKGSQELQII